MPIMPHKCVIFLPSLLVLTLGLTSLPVISNTAQKIYKRGLVLHFILTPNKVYSRSGAKPLVSMLDKSGSFNSASFQKNKSLVKYSAMSHGLLWQGFFKADKTGDYTFFIRGSKAQTYCQFDVTLSNVKLFSISKPHLHHVLSHKTLALKKGMHRLEVWLACTAGNRHFSNDYIDVDIKRPEEGDIRQINANELLHKL